MNRNETVEILTALDAVAGVSGYEDAVGDTMASLLNGCGLQETRDTLGNRFFIKEGRRTDFRVMLSAHLDEVGFLVSDIDDDGYVTLLPVGLIDARLLPGQVLLVDTTQGPVAGVTGFAAAPHEHKGETLPAVTMADIRLDVGARSRAQAMGMGISPGDPAVCDRGSRMLGRNTFSGRAVDNRAGCAAMILTLRRLRETAPQATIIACGSVQEELGVKGVRAAAASIRPDIAITFDVCFASMSDSPTYGRARALPGRGPAIQAYDWSPMSLLGNMVPRRLRERLCAVAQSHRIPHQIEVTLNGGTDAAEIALSNLGVLSGAINIPCRYMHSAVGTVDVRDVYNASSIAAAFLRETDAPF